MPVPPLRRRARTTIRRRVSIGAASLAVAATLAGGMTIAPSADVARAVSVPDVMAWVPYWEVTDSVASINAHASDLAEITPFFFSATSATDIVNKGTEANRQKIVGAPGAAGKPVVATITDGMGPRQMAAILADPAARTAHVDALVAFAAGYSGLDIDYESFAFNDGRSTWRDPSGEGTYKNWGLFLTELSTKLHAQNKTLATAVPPIYDNLEGSASGYWVYNYPVMAQVVDRVRIMTYSYSGSGLGVVTPYWWVQDSIEGAVAAGVPRSKIVLGLAAYGNDAVTKVEGTCPVGTILKSRTVTNQSAAATAARKGVVPTFVQGTAAKPIKESTFSYVESLGGVDAMGIPVRCNVSRTVWYSSEQTIYERALLARNNDLAGIGLWAMGYDNAATWDAMNAGRNGLGYTPPAPLPIALEAPAVLPPYPAPITSSGPLPARFVDTRAEGKTADGLFQGDGRRAADSTLEVQIGARGPVPGGATAVTLNVTALGAGTGFVTVYPCGERPTTSSLNVRAGQTISNSVITKLSPAGTVCIYTQQAADLVVDVFNVLPASTFVPVASPARLLDTRAGEPTIDGRFSGVGALPRGTVLQVPVGNRGGMSGSTKTAVLNVTAVGAVGNGYLTVWPCDAPQPETSNVNFTPGAATPNAVVTALAADGTACVFASNTTDVVIDTFGALGAASYEPLIQPARLLETRSGLRTTDGAANGLGKRESGQVTELQVATRAGLPAGTGAVVLNVTVDAPELPGFVTVYPCGTARPFVSNVNFAAAQTLPNLVVTKLSPTGTVCIYTHVKVHVIVDAFGALAL